MRLFEARIADLFKLDVAPNPAENSAEFWEDTIERVARAEPVINDEALDYPADNIEVHDVTFTGMSQVLGQASRRSAIRADHYAGRIPALLGGLPRCSCLETQPVHFGS